MGKWAEKNVEKLSREQFEALSQILDEVSIEALVNPFFSLSNLSSRLFRPQENPDLWKWLTGQAEAPESMKKNPVRIVVSCSALTPQSSQLT